MREGNGFSPSLDLHCRGEVSVGNTRFESDGKEYVCIKFALEHGGDVGIYCHTPQHAAAIRDAAAKACEALKEIEANAERSVG